MPSPTASPADYKQAVLDKISNFSFAYTDLEAQKPSGDGWILARCPFHEDNSPSFSFSKSTGGWCCHAGCGSGDIFAYLMHRENKDFKVVLDELGDRFGVSRPSSNGGPKPPIPESYIEECTGALWASETLIERLKELRGLNEDTLKKYEIGWDSNRKRYTIPIRDEHGELGNVRLYSPDERPKLRNYTQGKHRYGSPARLYGADELVQQEGGQVILCEGEWDRLVLQRHGLTAVTGTHGASTFRPEWVQLFKDRDVVVVYDSDPEGQKAALDTVIPALRHSEAASVKNIVLPLGGTKDEKDITDYFQKSEFTITDLLTLIEESPSCVSEDEEHPEDILPLASFIEIEKPEHVDRKVQCEITVNGESSEGYHAVEEFQVQHCSGSKDGKCFACKGYPEPASIPHGSQLYIGSCMSTNTQVLGMLRAYACSHGQKPRYDILKRTTVTEFFCHQKVSRFSQTRNEAGDVVQLLDGVPQELMEKRVYLLSSRRPKPGNYLATGWIRSHPKTQQVTFVIETMEPQEDDFQAFRIKDNLAHLQALRMLSYDDLLDDLTRHVTRIYDRREILEAVLLTYCSPRWLSFNRDLIRGWLNVIILGDSGSGKTQTHQRIAEHANVGDIFSGLTGSRTGLTYALVDHKQQGWQVRIGRLPANSGKILTVDEAQHLPEWELRTLAKAMDEGFLQVDRVQSRGYACQTRLILIANPKKDAVMDSFAFGCEALTTIFPSTIIRRMDIAVFANSGDLQDLSMINAKATSARKGKVSPEMLRALIYWSWNLSPEQIIFTSDAESDCLKLAEEMSDIFGHAVDVPLVPRSDARNKLARIAAAFAVLRLSADESFSRLIVEPKHVQMAMRYLYNLYARDNCSLNDYSEIVRMGSELVDYDEIEKAFLKKQEEAKHASNDEQGLFPRVLHLLRINKQIRREDLAEQAGCSVETVKRIVKLLKRFNLIDATRDGYVKKPKFNKFIRRFLKNHSEFVEAVSWGSGFNAMEDNELDRNSA